MEFAIVNTKDDPRTRVLLKVITKDPKDERAAERIADAIEERLSALAGLLASNNTTQRVSELEVTTMVPEDGGFGRWFYFLDSTYRFVERMFERIVWSCIHNEVGEELD
jgi:hypothetical protein